jgi:hypothetical protein
MTWWNFAAFVALAPDFSGFLRAGAVSGSFSQPTYYSQSATHFGPQVRIF